MSDILSQTIKHIFTPGKGILASDERPSSANKNLEKAGISPSDALRKDYRELFINTEGFEKFVSAMIISDETFWQSDSTGKLFVQTLIDKSITPVIKVDESLADLPFHPSEKLTRGIDGLDEKLAKYFENGARAAKWRAVFTITDVTPSDVAIDANITLLALYSMFCLKNNIVPIVEPEVIYKGNYSLEQGKNIQIKVLSKLFDKHLEYGIDLGKVILKSSMALPGKESAENARTTAEQIGQATIEVFTQSVPKQVAGIVFLSGGQDPMQATNNLNAIAKANHTHWPMTFSFLRAIEAPAAETWAGKPENVSKAREVFLKKLELDSKASQGVL